MTAAGALCPPAGLLHVAALAFSGGWLSPAGETVALSLSSAAIWGTSDFVGGIAAQRIRSSAVVAISHTLSLLILVGLALATRAALPDTGSAVYGLAAGVACGTGVIVLYKALALGSMGITASISGVLAAVLPVVFAIFTEGMPTPRHWLGFAVGVAAIWLIAAAPNQPGTGSTKEGLLLGAAAGVSFGLLFILLKLAGRGGVLWPLACSRVTSASLAAAITVFSSRVGLNRGSGQGEPPGQVQPAGIPQPITIAPGPVPHLNAPDAPASSRKRLAAGMSWAVLGLAAMAGTFDASGNSFYTIATRTGRLDIAAVLSSLYPAATILLAAWLLKERTSRTQAMGMVLALVAVVLISI